MRRKVEGASPFACTGANHRYGQRQDKTRGDFGTARAKTRARGIANKSQTGLGTNRNWNKLDLEVINRTWNRQDLEQTGLESLKQDLEHINRTRKS